MAVRLLNGLGAFCSSGLPGSPIISRAMTSSLLRSRVPKWSAKRKKSVKSTTPLPSRSKRESPLPDPWPSL